VCPASISRRAIGCPILPSPMKPMSMNESLVANAGGHCLRLACSSRRPAVPGFYGLKWFLRLL
jgi:hypothetical protein